MHQEVQIMLDDPNVVSAIVAGSVALVVSALSGIYTVLRNRKRFDDLRNELLVKASVERFVNEKNIYLDVYRKFEIEFMNKHEEESSDDTEAIQLAVDFYSETARDFYLRNKSFLKSVELDNLFRKISSTIESGKDNEKNDFGKTILSFHLKLNKKALEIDLNP